MPLWRLKKAIGRRELIAGPCYQFIAVIDFDQLGTCFISLTDNQAHQLSGNDICIDNQGLSGLDVDSYFHCEQCIILQLLFEIQHRFSPSHMSLYS
ncbi:hypothetical protein D3C76_1613830 [compost metagenome]